MYDLVPSPPERHYRKSPLDSRGGCPPPSLLCTYRFGLREGVSPRLVELVTDNVPPADHLSDLEDPVRLDGVQEPALVLARLVQLAPERDVRCLLRKLADCFVRGAFAGVSTRGCARGGLIAARRRACDSEESSSQHVSRREGGRRRQGWRGGFCVAEVCKEREFWRGRRGEAEREEQKRRESADQSLFSFPFLVGEAKSETYRCRKPGPTRAGQASRRRRPAWRPRERRRAVYATRYQDVREMRE